MKKFFRKTKDTCSSAVTSATLSGAAIVFNKVLRINNDCNKKYILSISKGPTYGLSYALTARATYSINITKTKNKFCLNLNSSESNKYLFVNRVKMQQFKAKNSKITAYR